MTLVEWLKQCEMKDVRPAKVIIGEETFEAAIYDNPRTSLTGGIFCLGNLPKPYAKNSNTCFRFEGSDYDWYVAAYYPEIKKHKQADVQASEFHPFGATFILAKWDVPNSSIDDGQKHPRHRVQAILQKE